MNILDDWLHNQVSCKTAPLFLEEDLVVSTFFKSNLRKLSRNPEFDQLMISVVEEGLTHDSWQGLIYMMHWLDGRKLLPLYIGKAEKRGVRQPISFNIANIRKNNHAFARWGYGLAYHIGDLSHAMFGGIAYKPYSRNYRRWAERLFVSFDPPVLRRKVYVSIISWHLGMVAPSGLTGSVPSVEKEMIALASVSHPDILLNKDGI